MEKWIVFHVIIFLMIWIDLKGSLRQISRKKAFMWTFIWIGAAVLYAGWIGLSRGFNDFTLFITAYFVEKTLSIDNVLLFSVIFTSLKIPHKYQTYLLFWGVLGAIVMRGLMIYLGIIVIQQFEFVIYIFALILLWTAVRMLVCTTSYEDSIIFKLGKILPVQPVYEGPQGEKFIFKKDGKRYCTLLCLALFLIEGTDLMFAIDSIPAVLAITKDPFIVYTSNVFSILGLRALYVALSHSLKEIPGLQVGLALVLIFVAFKMTGLIAINPIVSLGIIVLLLLSSILVTKHIDKKRL
jgi:tellurite resistance protein TerC